MTEALQRANAAGRSRRSPPTRLGTYSVNSDPSVVLEDFQTYRGKTAKRAVVMRSADRTLVLSGKNFSRYFVAGRRKVKRTIKARLGQWWYSDGVMVSITYDPKRTDRLVAWRHVSTHFNNFLDNLEKAYKRKGRRRPSYVWVLEEQTKSTNYPHLHVFFPGLHYLAPFQDLNRWWGLGDVDAKRMYNVNVTAYVTKYITKLEHMTLESQSLLWAFRKRLWSCSRTYRLPVVPKPAAGFRYAGSYPLLDSGGCHLADYLCQDFAKLPGLEIDPGFFEDG